MVFNRCLWFVLLPLLASPKLLQAAPLDAAIIDPTRPVHLIATTTNKEVNEQIVLQAIVIGAQRREVIINNRRLHVGDELNGMRIIKILPGKVVYDRNGTRGELRLHSSILQAARVEE